MDIKDQFKKEQTVINLSYYEVYYQISLGKILSISDSKDINFEVDFTLALGSLFELINDIKDLDNAENILINEIKKQAAMDALQNFTNKNLEAIKNRIIKIDELVNEINDDEFFDEIMSKLSKDNYENIENKYKNLITDELSLEIQESLKELIK